MKHIVSYSGGLVSWGAAKRTVKRYGKEDTILLFADTKGDDPHPHKGEDEDLYRFLRETVTEMGATFVRISEGRDVWQVFKDERFIGNHRVDPCSRGLKREMMDKWISENFTPEQAHISVGLDWTEMHRLVRFQERMKPWVVEAPMTEPPYMTREQLIEWLRAEGIEPPRLYAMGFPHNNCGGFCIKAGIDNFRLLLHTMPERYAYHEQKEQELREYLGKDVSILRDRSGGVSKPLTLKALREREECLPMPLGNDFGGCGCAIAD